MEKDQTETEHIEFSIPRNELANGDVKIRPFRGTTPAFFRDFYKIILELMEVKK